MRFRCWQHLSTSEIDSIKNSQPVVLVGFAVSDFIPTNLPSGGAVAWDLLTLLAQSGPGVSWPDWLLADAKRHLYPGQSLRLLRFWLRHILEYQWRHF
jgi:hypothetical protein